MLRARVMSMWTVTIVGGPALGSALAGALAGWLGPGATSLAFAVACLALVALLVLARRRPASQSA
jgi:MFS family permease